MTCWLPETIWEVATNDTDDMNTFQPPSFRTQSVDFGFSFLLFLSRIFVLSLPLSLAYLALFSAHPVLSLSPTATGYFTPYWSKLSSLC